MCVRLCGRSLFSKNGEKDPTYRRDILKTIPCVDVVDGSDQSEEPWKDGLIDEGLLSLLEEDDGGESAGVGVGVGYTVDAV